MVVASSVLWAMQPAFLLAAGRAIPDNTFAFLLINVASLSVISWLALAYFHSRAGIAEAFRTRRVRRDFAAMIAVDSVAVTASYLLLIRAAGDGNLAAAAIFFESWPIFVALLLFAYSPRSEDRMLPVRLSLLLFLVGLYLIQLSEGAAVSRLISLQAAYPILSAMCMAVGVFATQMFLRGHAEFTSFKDFLLIVAGRSAATTLCVGILLLFSSVPGVFALRVEFVAASTILGIIVFGTTVLYHIGVARAESNAVALVALLSPVMAPVFLFAVGMGLPSLEFFMGAAFVIAGLAVMARTRDNTTQFQTLLFLMLAAGAAIIFIDGLNVANYYLYMQTTAVFYGLFQTSALARLYGRYARAKQIALEIYEICRARALRDDPLALPLRKRELRSIKSEVSSVSELLLLTQMAAANVLLAVIARDNSLEGDTIAYVVTIASSFMVLICWYYQLRIMSMTPLSAVRLSRRPKNVLMSRSLSYIVTSVLFFWILFMIVYKHQPFAAA